MSDVERQLERGSLFTHTALSEIAQRGYETQSLLLGLIDTLIAGRQVDEAALTEAAGRARDALDAHGETVAPGVALRVDPPEPQPTVAVDCAARMPVCRAACCKLAFALSAEEVERGVVKWDLGMPYVNRHEADGYCTHCDRSTGACGVYEDRPTICRTYSCAGDERIWKDFDNMILNDEWIADHCDDPRPSLLSMAMQPEAALPD